MSIHMSMENAHEYRMSMPYLEEYTQYTKRVLHEYTKITNEYAN